MGKIKMCFQPNTKPSIFPNNVKFNVIPFYCSPEVHDVLLSHINFG